ncbi:hypothetical protein L8R84_27215 [Vibrio splendidus]|uniref:hypothetical protein n=1 Tax=Vibrio splendidus TaxID=29497 RepID=UPI002468456F|nr:hypothetical protein [Vibrio splendidus]MDH5939765.1 hypothetical protein [Vibrio splendidus]
MSNYIRRVRVSGLFEDDNQLTVDFDQKLNCIYGYNGTGKTVLLNLIVDVIDVNLQSLQRSPFNSITLLTSSNKQAVRYLTVHNNFDDVYFEFHQDQNFTINIGLHRKRNLKLTKGTLYSVSSQSDGINQVRIVNKNDRAQVGLSVLKSILKQELSITYVPLLRMGEKELRSGANSIRTVNHDRGSNRYLTSIQEEFSKQYALAQSNIARKLEVLSSSILEKLFISKSEINDIKYHKMAKSLISSGKVETNTLQMEEVMNQIQSLDLKIPPHIIMEHYSSWNKVQVDLIEASKALSQIDEKCSESMRDELFNRHTKAYFSFLTTVGTYKKIQDAINQIEKVYYDRSLYLEKFNNFRDAINDFLQGEKEFNFDDDGTFRFSNKGRPVRISQLSSGEKHLIAIFGHLCVSNDDSSVFIADEGLVA